MTRNFILYFKVDIASSNKSNPVRKQSSIKDEDLDHFLMDMDLEQLGQGIEERLSFTVDDN